MGSPELLIIVFLLSTIVVGVIRMYYECFILPAEERDYEKFKTKFQLKCLREKHLKYCRSDKVSDIEKNAITNEIIELMYKLNKIENEND